jgi:flavin reductase (DIM6/NTAB) family NADH-FMN oxidoreductase RutF
MEIDPNALATRDVYGLLTSMIVPRPIAWVSTKAKDGSTNLAPFSYFNGVGSDPMMVSIAIGQKRGPEGFVAKDTLRNLKATGVCCIHLVEEAMAAAMDNSAADYPADVSEIEALGLATVPTVAIDGVRLVDARMALECRLLDVHVYGRKGTFNLVVAEVVRVHVDDSLLEPEPLAQNRPLVDPHLVAPVARLGGPHYARLGERFQNDRKPVS